MLTQASQVYGYGRSRLRQKQHGRYGAWAPLMALMASAESAGGPRWRSSGRAQLGSVAAITSCPSLITMSRPLSPPSPWESPHAGVGESRTAPTLTTFVRVPFAASSLRSRCVAIRFRRSLLSQPGWQPRGRWVPRVRVRARLTTPSHHTGRLPTALPLG